MANTVGSTALSDMSPEERRRNMMKAVVASTVGTSIEWYDYFLFGTMGALVFAKLFFPKSDPLTGTLNTYAIFFAGFLARPVGAWLFGTYGDRIGRKATLIATLLLMGIATFVIGLMPTYSSIGLWAAVILVALRLCQGIGVGGEWGGSVLMSMEWGSQKRKGFLGSWPQFGVPVGLLLSTAITAATVTLAGEATFVAWAWRIPFLLSIILVGVGLYIRLGILETPVFQALMSTSRIEQRPVTEVVRRNWREIILSALLRLPEQAPFYLFTVFVVTYGVEKLHLGRGLILNAITIAAVLEFFTIPLYGYLSDSVGRRRWYLLGCVLMAAFAFPYFLLMNTGSAALFTLAVVLSLAVFHAWMYGPQAALIAERFGTRARYSGASLGYQLAAPFAGGPAPIIALLLLTGKSTLAALGLSKVVVNIGAGSWQAVAFYIVVLAAISFAAVLGLKELTTADISSVEAYKVGEAEVVLSATD